MSVVLITGTSSGTQCTYPQREARMSWPDSFK